jgi:hypothetical protein
VISTDTVSKFWCRPFRFRFPLGSFLTLSMFAPKPFDVAKELVRVTKPGGRIVMGNWIPNDPTSFVSQAGDLAAVLTRFDHSHGWQGQLRWTSNQAVGGWGGVRRFELEQCEKIMRTYESSTP